MFDLWRCAACRSALVFLTPHHGVSLGALAVRSCRHDKSTTCKARGPFNIKTPEHCLCSTGYAQDFQGKQVNTAVSKCCCCTESLISHSVTDLKGWFCFLVGLHSFCITVCLAVTRILCMITAGASHSQQKHIAMQRNLAGALTLTCPAGLWMNSFATAPQAQTGLVFSS